MKSSTGAHFIAIDHIRALAALMVFTWHFIHAGNGYPIPFNYLPNLIPFSIFDEGHTGVALFMTLSGYLFSKLLNGKSIDYKAFFWNRALRLLPLLVVVIIIVGLRDFKVNNGLLSYFTSIAKGAIFPTLPNGGWSITVEFHYYLMLPLFLWILAKSKNWFFLVILVTILVRTYIFNIQGEVQSDAYWTIIGRIDQFLMGMLAYHLRHYLAHRHYVALLALTIFTLIYWYFDSVGGFYENPSYPSVSAIWIILPTIEAVAYGIGIAWYDNSFAHSTGVVSKFIGRIGEYSYSIYLLHVFVVFRTAKFVDENIMDISNFYLACLWSLVCFILMMIPAHISFKYIETPFLKFRKPYIKSN